MNNDLLLAAYRDLIKDGVQFSCLNCGEKIGKFDAVKIIQLKVIVKFF